jgi:tripartite-type tricarboxylate transporter receptor subunit TctC
MSISRRALTALPLALLARPAAAAAASYPDRPIRAVVPYGAGGITDQMMRLLGQKLTPRLGQPVVVENRAGAGGMIGTENIIRSEPDGYSLLFATVTLTVYPSFNRNFTYDIHRALAPVSIVASAPYVIMVAGNAPYRSLQELMEAARRKPEALNFGSPGVGTSTHLAFEAFLAAAGLKMTHIPYGGSAAAQTALLSNDIQVMIDTYGGLAGAVESGQGRALAITAATRGGFNPAIPTVAEAGLPGFTADTWFGLLAPSRTPGAVIERLHVEIVEVLKDPVVIANFSKQGTVVGSSPAQFAETLVLEQRRWAKVIADAGITPQ